MMSNRKRRRPSPFLGACAGILGGLVGSWAMVRFNHLIGPDDSRGDKPADRFAHHRDDARPNDIDATIPDEPGSMQAASAVAQPLLGRPLTLSEKEMAGPVMHYLFGAALGAVYGIASEKDSSAAHGAGIPYGIGVWLFADEIGMHAAGFATRPDDYPVSRHAAALASHIVFGLTLEGVRRALRGRS